MTKNSRLISLFKPMIVFGCKRAGYGESR